ncbi:hypothetical protein HDV05_005408 [Chytridiales sp. JEL 0842]|nr:hypothetical protein HDV05_005408 [Chytridiales sp. JEL 0842]
MERPSSYVSTYVRKVLANPETRQDLIKKLDNDLPYVDDHQFSAIVMVDISGYSSLTSNLSTLGKLSSELITNTVNDYLAKIIDLITCFDGDIIKVVSIQVPFCCISGTYMNIGDAVIVSFGKSGDHDTHEKIVARAVLCCVEILRNYSVITVDLAINGSQSPQSTTSSGNEYRTTLTRRKSIAGSEQRANPPTGSISLGIHVAVTAGQVSHCIVGIPRERMDYCIHGPSLDSLGEVLDSAKKGELGISSEALSCLAGPTMKRLKYDIGTDYETHVVVGGDSRLESAQELLTGVVGDALDHQNQARRSSVARSHSISEKIMEHENGSVSLPGFFHEDEEEDEEFEFSGSSRKQVIQQPAVYEGGTNDIPMSTLVEKFLNQSLLKKIQQASNDTRTRSHSLSSNNTQSSTVRKISTMNRNNTAVAPLIKEFRTVTIIFVKLYSAFNAHVAQRVKGKIEPVLVWTVKGRGSKQFKGLEKRVFGYAQETKIVKDEFESWLKYKEGKIILIEGRSGMGKSQILAECISIMNAAQVSHT